VPCLFRVLYAVIQQYWSSVFFKSTQHAHAWSRHATEGSNHVTCVFCVVHAEPT
jgi:hypothetical protein